MSTEKNLKDAFAGESQANRKYLAFAKKAEQEGHAQIAKLFRATAEAETIHAHAHLAALGGIKDTATNLQEAAGGEAFEFKSMYPPYLDAAAAEGNKQAALSFKYAMKAEEVHYTLYSKALETLKSGKDLEKLPIYLCPVCGNIEIGEVDGDCEICHTKKEKFIEIK
jgi:rubrerythrin